MQKFNLQISLLIQSDLDHKFIFLFMNSFSKIWAVTHFTFKALKFSRHNLFAFAERWNSSKLLRFFFLHDSVLSSIIPSFLSFTDDVVITK